MRVTVIPEHGDDIRWKQVTDLKWVSETHITFRGARSTSDYDPDGDETEPDPDDEDTQPVIRFVEVTAPIIIVEG